MLRTLAVAAIVVSTMFDAHAQAFRVLPDVGTLYAYDAKGMIVGAFAPVPQVAGSIGGVIRIEVVGEGIVYIPVTRVKGGLVWSSATPWFESTDCTGPAFGKHTVTSVGDHAAYVGLNGTLYIGPADGGGDDAVFRQLRSRVVISANGSLVCSPDTTSSGVPLREIAKLDDTFEPPFGLAPPSRLRSARH